MNQYLKLLFIFFLLQNFHISVWSQEDDLRIEIDKIIRYDTELDFSKTPGFVVSVVDNDNVFHYSFGTKVRKEKVQFTPQDIFELGSVTKVFTSELIKILIKDGLITENDEVNKYLPEPFRNPRLDTLTISDLVNHKSGFPKRPAFFGKKEKDIRNPYANYKVEDLLKYYRDYIPDEMEFEYSHTNFALLELIIQHITNKSLEDVLQEKIFKPLQLENTFLDFPEKKENLICPGYDRSQKVTPPWTFASFKASEGIKSTPEDLVKFVQTYLDDKNQAHQHQSSSESFNKQLGIIMGWHAIHMGNFDILTHTGKTSGHNAFVGMVRETKTAIIILANSSIGAEDLGLQILRMINFNWKRIKV